MNKFGELKVTQVTRSAILDEFILGERSFHGRLDLMSFLKRVWPLADMPSTDGRFENAEGDIWQHMVRNYDWDEHYLLCERLNLLGCDDETFLRFLETCLHPLAVPDEEEAKALAHGLNKHLEIDGFRLVVSSRISGRPVFSAVDSASSELVSEDPDVFEVVLSFAGEDREYVEAVASYLRGNDVSCFYDKYQDVTLWGKDLAEHLDKVYRSARYCIMFISKYYAEKIWPSHERRSALAREVEKRGEYILPARFDSTEVPGIRHTIGYVDLRGMPPEQFGKMVLRKLGRKVGDA